MSEKQDSNVELEEVALDIYSARVARSGRGSEQAAVLSFQDAAKFLEVRNRVREGKLPTKAEAPVGDAASAPNLKPRHPINLLSQRFGNRQKAVAALKFLKANPNATSYDELEWGEAEVKVARELYPRVLEASVN